MDTEQKRRHEAQTLETMVALWGRGHRHKGDGLCGEWLRYAQARTACCPRMAVKTFCSGCPQPCYTPARRGQICRVMRYAGPRMLLHARL